MIFDSFSNQKDFAYLCIGIIACSVIAGDGDDRGDSIAGDVGDGGSRYAEFIGDSGGGRNESAKPRGGAGGNGDDAVIGKSNHDGGNNKNFDTFLN